MSQRNSILDAIKSIITGLGYNNVMYATTLPMGRIRADRKPVFYLISRGGENLPEHPVIEDYYVDIVFAVQSLRDNYGGKALLEANDIRAQIIALFEVREESTGFPYMARVYNSSGPVPFNSNIPSIQITTVSLVVNSYVDGGY